MGRRVARRRRAGAVQADAADHGQPVDMRARIERFYSSRGWEPFTFQREVWNAIERGESGLVHAATGTGKTLAVWFGALAALHEEVSGPSRETALPPPAHGIRVVWLTPLKALAADTARALRDPLEAVDCSWTVALRTGDTSPSERRRQREKPAEAIVTTPESLSILLSLEDAEERFAGIGRVVVDEWHELLSTKRGVLTELALARLRRIVPGVRTWGLSATLGNVEEAAWALLGSQALRTTTPSVVSDEPRIVRADVGRRLAIETLIPPRMERFPWAGHMGMRLLPQVLTRIEQAGTTLVFTNTRSQAERWFEAIGRERPEWRRQIAIHHGSIDHGLRLAAEAGLREGTLRCVVATSSLDLGVDFGPVEQVIQIGSPKGIGRLLQRAGRSGHRPGVDGRLVCVPTHALELVECAAARAAVAAGAVEPRRPLAGALDVLAQHIVSTACSGGFREEELLAEVRTTAAYHDLDDRSWGWAIGFAARGGPALAAYPDYARIRERFGRWYVASPAIARRHRSTIGTITGDATVEVRFVGGRRLGSVEESFIARVTPGRRFLFAGRCLAMHRLDSGTAWVKRAKASDAGIQVPRWNGGRMPLSTLLASEVESLVAAGSTCGVVAEEAAAVAPLLATQARWSRLPEPGCLLVESVALKDGVHVFVFPFEGRLVHEGLAALSAWRISRRFPCTLVFAMNDWGFEISGRKGLEQAGQESFWRTVLSPANLLEDLLACVNGTELARRHFREVARVAGLVGDGSRGGGKRVSNRNLQASAGLLFDVLAEHDPGNMLLAQSRREVLEEQFEFRRLSAAIERIAARSIIVEQPGRLTPLAFPIWAEQVQNRFSSQGWLERIVEMAESLEAAAGDGA
ncbi:MAG: ligase-associated DNA damage response DEXH box helicase [Planctomycetaceae bacterium]